MSLSVKQISLLLAFVSVLCITACDDPKEIGLPQGQALGVFFTDQVTVKTSTVLVDSVISSSGDPRFTTSAFFLVGKYNDPKLGILSASSYFQPYYSILSDTSALNLGSKRDSLKLDSLVLFLDYSHSYGDISQPNTVSVHTLQEALQEKKRYTHEKPVYNPTPVGSGSFKPVFSDKDTVTTAMIKLSNTLGLDVLDFHGTNETDFQNAFKGLALVPGSNDRSVMSYLPSYKDNGNWKGSRMRLYYKDGEVAKTYDFVMGVGHFNHIEGNRQGTVVASLQNPYNALPASQTSEETYVQAGVGIMTKVELTDINKLLELGDIAINKAELIVSPITTSGLSLPPKLILYDATEQGFIKRDMSGYPIPIRGDILRQIPLATLKNSTYSFEVTDYVARIFQNLRNNKTTSQTLFLSIPSIALDVQVGNIGNGTIAYVTHPISLENNVSRVAIGSQQHPTHPLKLRIYYTPISPN